MPVFEAIDRDVLSMLAKAFVTEQFAAERVVIREGDEGDRFYVIARGRLEVSRNGHDDRPQRDEFALEDLELLDGVHG